MHDTVSSRISSQPTIGGNLSEFDLEVVRRLYDEYQEGKISMVMVVFPELFSRAYDTSIRHKRIDALRDRAKNYASQCVRSECRSNSEFDTSVRRFADRCIRSVETPYAHGPDRYRLVGMYIEALVYRTAYADKLTTVTPFLASLHAHHPYFTDLYNRMVAYTRNYVSENFSIATDEDWTCWIESM